MNHGWIYRDVVRPVCSGCTALDFYAKNYRHSTAAAWRERLLRGEITRGGRALSPSDLLSEGDMLAWRRPPWEEGEVPRDIKVVYEDDAILAVDKPAGLPVVPDGGFLENTLVHLLWLRYPGEEIVPAHRLNRGTSGLVVCSRTPLARRNLAAQFRDKTARREAGMKKIYYALTPCYPGGKPGDKIEVTTPIGAVRHPWLGTVYAASPSGKPSCSRCEIVETRGGATLWRVDLVTGRSHQIRIHLAALGVPLLGDPLFLPGGHPRPDALPGDCGYFLRSASLSLRHPTTGAAIVISVSLNCERAPFFAQ